MKAGSFVSACSTAWSARDLSTCKPLGLDASTWIAGLTALAALLVFLVRQAIYWRRRTRLGSDYIAGNLRRSRFRNLCRAIKPLMDENYRIFSRFGPNGDRGDGSLKEVRFELGVWYQLRNQIVENNARIRVLVTVNLSAVPLRYRATFTRWLDHIDAFRAHVLDPHADYREHQFPKEATTIVNRYA